MKNKRVRNNEENTDLINSVELKNIEPDSKSQITIEYIDGTKRWDKLYNKNIGEHIPWLTDVIKRYESGQR